ncbi:hypothetical protein RRG08_004809 [Elysia crispata]|uniref:Uncharacterized protein n=1 Tax=Elysia crispata TaxID=231223 RepID=A0AAE1CSP8_9GAST|nr:hypothetical protein RRG08_004809 [Elysia crispata]
MCFCNESKILLCQWAGHVALAARSKKRRCHRNQALTKSATALWSVVPLPMVLALVAGGHHKLTDHLFGKLCLFLFEASRPALGASFSSLLLGQVQCCIAGQRWHAPSCRRHDAHFFLLFQRQKKKLQISCAMTESNRGVGGDIDCPDLDFLYSPQPTGCKHRGRHSDKVLVHMSITTSSLMLGVSSPVR